MSSHGGRLKSGERERRRVSEREQESEGESWTHV
jgi:hypothetical protein